MLALPLQVPHSRIHVASGAASQATEWMLRRGRLSLPSRLLPGARARDERVNVIRKGRPAKRKVLSGFLFVRICLTSRSGEGAGITLGMSDRCDVSRGRARARARAGLGTRGAGGGIRALGFGSEGPRDASWWGSSATECRKRGSLRRTSARGWDKFLIKGSRRFECRGEVARRFHAPRDLPERGSVICPSYEPVQRPLATDTTRACTCAPFAPHRMFLRLWITAHERKYTVCFI